MRSDTKIWRAGGLTGDEIARLREALLARRRQLMGGVEALTEEASRLGSDGSHADADTGDLGSDASEQDLCLNLLEGRRGELQEIDRALERMAEGAYGSCEECGASIPASRLEAIPHASLCLACRMREESDA